MFSDVIERYDWNEVGKEIYSKTKADVEKALQAKHPHIEDFKALVSPAAETYIEEMARMSRALTQKRFGKTMQLYIPLYLSNVCTNHCIYCGFNHNNDIKRIILTDEEILAEIKVVKQMGYEHILLLTGESPKEVGVDYITHAMDLIRPYFKQLSLEVYPMSVEEYKVLIQHGLHAVYIYQETYNRMNYTTYHPAGKKRDYTWRINTPDRLGQAEVHKIGLGALLGLEDWRVEAVYMAIHLRYLEKKYWKVKYSLAFPRIRPHVGGFSPNYIVNDKEFAQMIWAFRLFDQDLEMSLTTRESQHFRNHMVDLGITSMSAGSKTDPGGYALFKHELEQFAVNDNRSPNDLMQMIQAQDYEVVWKDWDQCFEKEKGEIMQDDFFDDLNDDSEELEHKELIERFERMLNNNSFDFFDSDDYALVFDHYFLTGKFNKAQKALSMGLKQYPDSVMLKLKKVHYLIYSQKQDDALILLNETENHILDNAEMLLEQAYLYSQLKQYDKSIKIYKQMLSHENEERSFMEDIYLGLAEVYEQKGEAKKTLRCLKQALELDPDNEYLISSVSDAFYDVVNEDEKHEIVNFFLNFVNKHSFSSPAWCCLGIAYYETDMYEKAIESFDYALALDGENEEAMLYQMKSYYKLNEHKKANEVFLALLHITRYKDLVWNQLGNCFYENEAYDNAMLSYQKSIDENENFSASYTGMAMVYAAMKNFSKAIENMQIAIELDGHNVEYWLLMAEYLSSDGQYDKAEKFFQDMAEQFPNEEELWLMYSDFYVLIHKLDKAIEILYNGIEKQPDNISYLYRMANYFYMKNDLEQANSFLTLAYMSNSELLKEFFEYDENMYNVPDVIEFLSNIKNNDE